MVKTKAKYRPISFLNKDGDFDWLRSKACPDCGAKGHLLFGVAGLEREQITCTNCGYHFRIKGRKIKA